MYGLCEGQQLAEVVSALYLAIHKWPDFQPTSAILLNTGHLRDEQYSQ